jgi:hypothetical protein
MCSAPKAPKVEKIPIHQAMVLPDGGDPAVRAGMRGQRKLNRSAMIFSNSAGTLGSPPVAMPSSGV